MNKYRIYCTEEQTKKALLNLGAPILLVPEEFYTDEKHFHIEIEGENASVILPTTEEMIGWLEEQEGIEGITIGYSEGIDWYFDVNNLSEPFISIINLNSRKEATIAAIDAALEYLTNNKK